MVKKQNRYDALIEKIFFDHHVDGNESFIFKRDEIEQASAFLSIKLPKNIGDVLYSFRFRNELPESILATQPKGKEWLIEMVGKGIYQFSLVKLNRIIPNETLAKISIPDSTPELIRGYALDDEQALLAIVRYNRLLDIFLGLTTYSLQNHLRTTVQGIGQIEIDELYVGVDKFGCHYMLPVQAKAGNDKISVVQTKQDLAWCSSQYKELKARAISVQFLDDDTIALFELVLQNNEIKVAEERHYQLVPAEKLTNAEISSYR